MKVNPSCARPSQPSMLPTNTLLTSTRLSYPVGASSGEGSREKRGKEERDLKLDTIRSPIGPSYV